MDGDVDSIMKLVLLIANHFRPPPEIPSQQSKPAAAFSHNQQRQHQQQQQQQSQQHQHPSIMHHHQGVSTGGMTHSISAPVHFMIDPGTNQMFNQMSGGTIGNGEPLKFQSPEFQVILTRCKVKIPELCLRAKKSQQNLKFTPGENGLSELLRILGWFARAFFAVGKLL